MELREVNPDGLTISEHNERRERIATSDLADSIREVGLLQPPLVRENGSPDSFEVVAGQRRVLAAQEAGVDTIPVLAMDWDDYEAVQASITENFEAFREDISQRDRAYAILKMAQFAREDGEEDVFTTDPETDREYPSPTWVADTLGAKRNTVIKWVERLRPQWEGTALDVRHVENETDHSGQSEKLDKIGDKALQQIRRATGGGEPGETVAEEVVDGDLSQDDLREVNQYTKHAGEDGEADDEQRVENVHEAVENVKQAREGRSKRYNVRFSGDVVNGIVKSAQERGTSEEQIIRNAVERYLDAEGHR
jgi:predicted DNA binding CopG/RHH family protein